jgi:acetyltransferase-like isoleucine patch superfamily enzyme
MNKSDDMLNALKVIYQKLRDRMRKKWNRDLPFSELLFDRWERAQTLGFGKGASIYHNSYVYGNVKVGENTWIGPNTLLDGTGGIEIGKNCSISAGVNIYTHDTVLWALSGGKAEYEYAPVTIGNCCYIGPLSVITKGIVIGDHSVIGACSFVNRDIPSYSIALGNPCRLKGVVNVDEDRNVSLLFDKKQR